MITTIILPDGPKEMEIVKIPDSPDGLAIIKEMAEDPTAASVVAQVPGHDAWAPMGSPLGVSHPDFPVGRVHGYLEDVIARLPHDVGEYLLGNAELAPSRIALARYLGFLSPEEEARLAEVLASSQGDEGDEPIPDKEEELDRQLKEREELRMSMVEEQRQIDVSTYHGFLDGKPSKEAGQIRLDLERLVDLDDIMVTTPVKNLIEHLVSKGCVVQDDPKDGKPILFDPATETGMRQQDLTRSGIAYARYLISLRDPKP
jgi:hypothetical protein